MVLCAELPEWLTGMPVLFGSDGCCFFSTPLVVLFAHSILLSNGTWIRDV